MPDSKSPGLLLTKPLVMIHLWANPLHADARAQGDVLPAQQHLDLPLAISSWLNSAGQCHQRGKYAALLFSMKDQNVVGPFLSCTSLIIPSPHLLEPTVHFTRVFM